MKPIWKELRERQAGGKGPGKIEKVIGGEERSCFFLWESFFRERKKRRFVGENIKA